jgi:hypothetical protein
MESEISGVKALRLMLSIWGLNALDASWFNHGDRNLLRWKTTDPVTLRYILQSTGPICYCDSISRPINSRFDISTLGTKIELIRMWYVDVSISELTLFHFRENKWRCGAEADNMLLGLCSTISWCDCKNNRPSVFITHHFWTVLRSWRLTYGRARTHFRRISICHHPNLWIIPNGF